MFRYHTKQDRPDRRTCTTIELEYQSTKYPVRFQKVATMTALLMFHDHCVLVLNLLFISAKAGQKYRPNNNNFRIERSSERASEQVLENSNPSLLEVVDKKYGTVDYYGPQQLRQQTTLPPHE